MKGHHVAAEGHEGAATGEKKEEAAH